MILTSGQHAEKDNSGQHAITPAKTVERPKSLPIHTLCIEPPVIRESPEFAVDKTSITASRDSGSNRVHQLSGPSYSPKPRGAPGGHDNSSQVSKVNKIRATFSTNGKQNQIQCLARTRFASLTLATCICFVF